MRKGKKFQIFSFHLRSQLTAMFTVTITLMILLMAVLGYHQAERAIREQSADTIQQNLTQNAYNIVSYTEEIEKIMSLLATQDSLQEYMRRGWQEDFKSVEQANEIFNYTAQLMNNYSYVDSVYYYGSGGTALGIWQDRNLLQMEQDLELSWYSLGLTEKAEEDLGNVLWFGGNIAEDFFFGTESFSYLRSTAGWKELAGKFYITAIMGIWVQTDQYVVLVVNLDQEAFLELISKSDTSNEWESYIVDENGIIIVHSDVDRIGQAAELTVEKLNDNPKDYVMRDGMQINYYQVSELSWTLVSEISVNSLYSNLRTLRAWFRGFAVISIVVAFVLSFYSIKLLTAPLESLRDAMDRMENGELGEQLDENVKNELGLLGRQFNLMSKSIQTMVAQIREIEEEKRILEKEALQAQLNPHFLFNTLSNMRFMVKLGQNEQLDECFTALGQMLRPMYRSEGEFWTLGEELDYVQNYVTILNCRFGGKLSMEDEIPDELKEQSVLKFVLQPLIENTVEHGFGQIGKVMIVLGARNLENRLEIYVEDNGNGISQKDQERIRESLRRAEEGKELYRGHVGLVNIHRRLRVHFGENSGVRLESIPGVCTCVYLMMPVLNASVLGQEFSQENTVQKIETQ